MAGKKSIRYQWHMPRAHARLEVRESVANGSGYGEFHYQLQLATPIDMKYPEGLVTSVWAVSAQKPWSSQCGEEDVL